MSASREGRKEALEVITSEALLTLEDEPVRAHRTIQERTTCGLDPKANIVLETREYNLIGER